MIEFLNFCEWWMFFFISLQSLIAAWCKVSLFHTIDAVMISFDFQNSGTVFEGKYRSFKPVIVFKFQRRIFPDWEMNSEDWIPTKRILWLYLQNRKIWLRKFFDQDYTFSKLDFQHKYKNFMARSNGNISEKISSREIL